jgi:outer membrane protein TolC
VLKGKRQRSAYQYAYEALLPTDTLHRSFESSLAGEHVVERIAALLITISLHATAWAQSEVLPDVLSLDEAVRIALHNRGEIAAARARADGLAERPAIVGALEDPMVSPSIDHYPFDMEDDETDMGDDSNRRYDWSVSIEQRFPLSGVLGHRKAAARADARRARALADSTELDIALDVQKSFYMLLEQRRMRRVLEEQDDLARELVRVAAGRYASGTGSQADVLRAEVEVARVQASRQVLVARIRAAEAMLNASLGRDIQEPIPELLQRASLDLPSTTEAAIAQALQTRPELAAGAAEVDRAAAEIDVMQSMYKPMAMLRVGRATTMAEGDGGMIMIGMSVPIWRGRLSAGVAEARAMRRMAEADLLAMRRMVEGEAAAARENVVAQRANVTALGEEVLPRALEAVEAALAGYASGRGTLVSVIESSRALWDVQAERVMAETALGEAWARLSRATGVVPEQPR